MAAVTLETSAPFFGKPLVNVAGSWRQYYYGFDLAADADYLDVPMRTVANVTLVNDTDTTAIQVAGITVSGYGSRIEFDSAGAVTGVLCMVTGH